MSWLRRLFSRKRMEFELDRELQFHFESQVADKVRSGIAESEARRLTRIEFGGMEQVKEDCRESRGTMWLESLLQDTRYGLRQLRKSPGFTIVVVLTLALGIGANTAIFTLVNAVMLRSLPVRDPQQLVVAQWSAQHRPLHLGTSSFGDCQDLHGMQSDCSLSYSMFEKIRGQKNLFTNAMAFAGPVPMDLSGNGMAASMAQGELVSGSYFDTLGVMAALGRTLDLEDEKPGAAPVAVLDYAYWQRAFGGSPGVIGRVIHLNNTAFTIVGVASPKFTRLTPGKSVDLWVPLTQGQALGQDWAERTDDNNWWLVVVGRLQRGVSRKQAQAAVNTLFVNDALHGAKPVWKAADDPHLWLLPAEVGLSGIRERYEKPLLLLMAAVGIVLLIACANVAGLILVRSGAREREMAVRLAVGAGRRRVLRQLLTESLLLSSLGAALGALLAYVGATGLAAYFSHNSYPPLQLNLTPNAPVLVFAVGVALLTGIGFGLAPAFRGSRANVATTLKGSTTSTGSGARERFGLGKGLVVIQVALSLVVLAGAGLLLRTLNNLHSINPGFNTRNILLFSVDPELVGYNKKQIPGLYASIQSRLSVLPGVVNVSYSSFAVLDGSLWTSGVFIEGQTDKNTVEAQMLSVGPEYFNTMKIPLMKGRVLQASDMKSKQLYAVVNQQFVRKYVKGRDPIGLHFGGDGPKDQRWQIVGVVGDTKYESLRSAIGPTAFVPLMNGGATFAMRTAASPAGLMPAVRNAVHQVDNNLPVIRMRTQSDAINRLLFNQRLMVRLLSLFGALGLLLTGIGLYGLLSYDVSQRTREIGIRTALGAPRHSVLLMVLKEGAVLTVAGVALGTVAAIAVTRLLGNLLYEVRPTDPFTFAITAAFLIAIGLIACLLPAWRATRVEPMTALRCE